MNFHFHHFFFQLKNLLLSFQHNNYFHIVYNHCIHYMTFLKFQHFEHKHVHIINYADLINMINVIDFLYHKNNIDL